MKGFQCIIMGFLGYRVYKNIQGEQDYRGCTSRLYRVYKGIGNN